MVSQETLSILHEKYQSLVLFMDERVLRRWAAAEARSLGWGGASAVSKATGTSRTTLRAGIAELHQPMPEPPPERIRRPGAVPLVSDFRSLVVPLVSRLFLWFLRLKFEGRFFLVFHEYARRPRIEF